MLPFIENNFDGTKYNLFLDKDKRQIAVFPFLFPFRVHAQGHGIYYTMGLSIMLCY